MNPLNNLFDELQDAVNDCQADVSKIIEVAEVFADWVLNDKKPTESNTNLPF